MTFTTINDAVTMPGGEGMLLAGRYRIVRQLGQGGMGSVWLAEDTQLDNKRFAIKMLPSILVSNKRAYNQLKSEALVAMRLTHPNIVTLRAFEENNGNPFLVMDYIDGQTLDDYLAEKGKLSEDETIKLLKPIAAALDYAHGEGVVHRDVKPANIMIRKDGHPYILDFGIAREIQETMTRVTGKLSSGTLLYMSPEQLHGTAPKKEQDVYSFAAMAYECLKGEPPFSRGQIEYQIDHDMPEPLVEGDGPIAPLAIGVMAGLSKKPEDRPSTCTEVLERGDIARKREDEAERKRREEAERRALADLDSSDRKDIVLSHKGDGPRHLFNGARGYLMAICTAIAVLVAIVIYVGSYSPKTRQRLDKRELVKSDYIHRLEKEAAERRAEAERREHEAQEAAFARVERLAKQRQEDAQRKAEEGASRLQQEEMAGEIEGSVPRTAKAQEENLVEQRRTLQEFAVARRRMEEERLSKETRKQQILEAVRILAINVSPSGVLSVGFVDSSQRPEVRYYMQVGDSRDGWLVKSADIVARTVMLKKDGVEVMLTLGSKPCAPIQNSRVEGKDGEKVNQLEEQTNGNVIQTLLGRWSCSTTLSGSNWTSAMKYEYNFKTDGGYTSILIGEVVIGKGGKTTIEERGTWSLSGNRLTLRAAGRSVNDGTFNPAIVNVYKYDLLWRNDGAFELRFAEVERTLVDGSISIIQYDAEGREIKRTKGKGNEYRSVETAKLFRRVPN